MLKIQWKNHTTRAVTRTSSREDTKLWNRVHFYFLRKYTASFDGVNNKRFSKATFVNRNFLTENLELRVFQCLPCRAALLPLSPQYCLSLAQNAFPQCCWILLQLYPPLLLRFRFSYPENRNNLYRQCFHLSTAGDLL